MANSPPQMHTDFPAWYATVSVGQPNAALARWPAILEAAKATTRSDIETFIRIAFKTKQAPSAEEIQKFTKTIHSTDNTFDGAAAARETQVLAASVLMHLCPLNVYAALAVTTAALEGGRKPNLPMDLVGAAERAIRTIAESSRRRTNLGNLISPEVKWTLTAEEAAQKQPKEMIEQLCAVVQQAFNTAAERENRILAAVGQQMKYADEELQMLWWLIGAKTNEGTPFEKIEASARPFTLGRELAERTATLPGPGSIRALLSRANLEAVGKASIPQAVNAMTDAWSKSAVGERSVSPVTLPLHSALHRRNETGSGSDWIKNWAAVTEMSETHAPTPLRLAEMFYRERLLYLTQS